MAPIPRRRRLLERRRDILMESYAYELIKKEGYKEGVRSRILQDIQQGTVEARDTMCWRLWKRTF